MAKAKKALRKSAQKFRRTEPYFHAILRYAIDHMALIIKKLGAPEVVVKVSDGVVVDSYANDKY